MGFCFGIRTFAEGGGECQILNNGPIPATSHNAGNMRVAQPPAPLIAFHEAAQEAIVGGGKRL